MFWKHPTDGNKRACLFHAFVFIESRNIWCHPACFELEYIKYLWWWWFFRCKSLTSKYPYPLFIITRFIRHRGNTNWVNSSFIQLWCVFFFHFLCASIIGNDLNRTITNITPWNVNTHFIFYFVPFFFTFESFCDRIKANFCCCYHFGEFTHEN